MGIEVSFSLALAGASIALLGRGFREAYLRWIFCTMGAVLVVISIVLLLASGHEPYFPRG